MTLPGIDDLAVALTLQGANLENNLERLEVIGDSFLKFIVSVGLYFNKSIDTHLFNEGILTMTRYQQTFCIDFLMLKYSHSFFKLSDSRATSCNNCFEH